MKGILKRKRERETKSESERPRVGRGMVRESGRACGWVGEWEERC